MLFKNMWPLQMAFLFLVACMCTATIGFTVTCKEADRKALLTFKHSFSDRYCDPLPSWVGRDCCSWDGVGCDVVTGNVNMLDMWYSFWGLEAREVSPALLELKYLTYLNLRSVNFNGSRFPEFFGSMRQLQHLDLSNTNSFTGKVPNVLGNLTQLVFLDLSHACWPMNSCELENLEWASKLKNLKWLDLSGIDLSQALDTLSILHKLPSLSYLYLNDCQMENSHLFIRNSTISSSSPIQHLRLSGNLFSGPFPPFNSWGIFSSLSSLWLSGNYFTALSPVIGNFSSLQNLDLSYNNLETLPPSLGTLSSLSSLDLSYNNLSVVHQVSLANLSSLTSLDISSNSAILDLSPDWMPPFQLESLMLLACKLNSPFPNWILTQKRLFDLDLSNSGIFGPLPINIGISMPSLTSIRLANNHINGSIPRSLCGLAGLNSLHLQVNTLSGIIPDCWVNSQLVEVDLSSNRLSGTIPSSLITASLYLLRLNNNSIEGELPLSWGNSDNLVIVDVSMNKLHGEIPTWNGATFPSLRILILRENRFEGKIPMQLCSIQTLHIINLASNNLVGTIPRCFGYFKSMGSMLHSSMSIASPPNPNIAPYSTPALSPAPTSTSAESPSVFAIAEAPTTDMSALEVIKGQEREYTRILDKLVNMDLSCNHLVGVIPAEITSLSLLLNLNLSHNHLIGTIPMEIGKMGSLESLDFSYNNLSGSIPETISSLDSLSKMNFSFNNLQGQIPTGRHLQTLNDSSIYTGNPGLCGDPLPKKCFGYNSAHPPTSAVLEDEGDNRREKMLFYMVIMLGFATGFWGVIGILVVHKKWRHAYFQIAEELTDWIYIRVAVRIAQANRGR